MIKFYDPSYIYIYIYVGSYYVSIERIWRKPILHNSWSRTFCTDRFYLLYILSF